MKLYTFYRSSAAYRVRIALNLKALDYQAIPYNLVQATDKSAEKGDYLSVNPQGLIPALIDEGENITQSLAIIEYLEEQHPEIPLLPGTAAERARIRAMAQAIACDIHPLNNLRVLNYLGTEMKQSKKAINRWYRHWITETFIALEKMVTEDGGDYCYKDTITMADVFLIPQMANARRFDTDLSDFPKLVAIDKLLSEHPAFQAAAPEAQPDAPDG